MTTPKKMQYDLLAPSSMGIRLTPINRQPVHTSELLMMRASSAETNVLSVSSALGLSTKVLTTFVKDSPIAQYIKNDLAKRHIQFEGIDIEQKDPWGYRHQINIADSGYGMRAPRVYNDRAGEVGKTLNINDFDLEKLFKHEGVRMVHISGLIAALSEETSQFCLKLVETAKQYGTQISFDINYRASFWKGREATLRSAFISIAERSDVLIGNEEDFQLALGVEGPKSGGKDIKNQLDAYKEMMIHVQNVFPNIKVCATTLRDVESANLHHWGAIVYDLKTWTIIKPRPIPVLDRIGGGDGFVGGLLYGMLRDWNIEKCAQFAWATGAMATTVIEDYVLPADEAQVWSIWSGNARVQR
jgi:2-dehydro-3-deoxygluconokinase